MPLSAQERAQRSADAMWADDAASAWIGMELISVDAGRADLALEIEAHHVNGHGICHGGIIFALADSAFAFACNSRNQRAVAQNNVISFIAPVKLGERLTAEAREVNLTGRSGIYDVTVRDRTGNAVAEMRGFSRTIKGALFDEGAG